MLTFQKLEPKRLEVDYGGKALMLVELSVPEVAEFKSAAASSVRVLETGIERLGGAGDLDPLLVRLALREVLAEGKLGKLSKTFIETLPPMMVKDLVPHIRDMNPALSEQPTVEGLDRDIARLQRLKESLDDAKN